MHDATAVRHSSVRLLLALAASLGFDVWTLDANQAYLQAAYDLGRKVYLRTGAIQLQPGELIQLIKPLYGLADSGDLWARTLMNFHCEGLDMTKGISDFSLLAARW
jgi:Reverse transcriptase (RNA-dependent DNA polymerase)